MKFIKQFGIILAVSFVGEMLSRLIPAPVPASIYGLVLMFLVLKLKIFPCSAVKETSSFLIEIMPLMFIPAAVGLLGLWSTIRPVLIPYLVMTVISTVTVMIVAGHVTQFVLKRSRNPGEKKNNDIHD